MSLTSAFGITSDDALAALSEGSWTCIERLCKHEPEQFELSNEYVHWQWRHFRADALALLEANPFPSASFTQRQYCARSSARFAV